MAALRPVSVNSGEIGTLIGGDIEAIEIDGSSVFWLDESGKNRGLAISLLATRIAHRMLVCTPTTPSTDAQSSSVRQTCHLVTSSVSMSLSQPSPRYPTSALR